jgi:hypothetical protein
LLVRVLIIYASRKLFFLTNIYWKCLCFTVGAGFLIIFLRLNT